MKLIKLCKELNTSLNSIIKFLKSNNIIIDNKPGTNLTDKHLELIRSNLKTVSNKKSKKPVLSSLNEVTKKKVSKKIKDKLANAVQRDIKKSKDKKEKEIISMMNSKKLKKSKKKKYSNSYGSKKGSVRLLLIGHPKY